MQKRELRPAVFTSKMRIVSQLDERIMNECTDEFQDSHTHPNECADSSFSCSPGISSHTHKYCALGHILCVLRLLLWSLQRKGLSSPCVVPGPVPRASEFYWRRRKLLMSFPARTGPTTGKAVACQYLCFKLSVLD